MESVHDYEIKNYFVDFENKQIKINISNEKVNKQIIFNNVFSFKFYDEMPFSIILDLEERPVTSFFKRNKELILEGQKNFWPIIFESMSDLEKVINESNQKYWVLYASYGLYGWVLSEGVEVNII